MRPNLISLLTFHIVSGLIPIGDQWGTEFLLSFMKNGYGQGKPYIIILTVDTANVDITNHWTSSSSTHVVAGGASLKVELAQAIRYTADTEQPELKTVTLRSDVNVTVYVMDHNSYSAEGYLAIPLKYLSTRYIAASYTQTNYNPAVQISAVNDNTEVSLTFNVANGGTCGVDLHVDGAEMTLKLQLRETVTIFCTHDLTGTYIRSSKPVSVLSGHPCAIVPASSSGLDMLMEMVVPIEALGTNFLLHNLAGRDSGAIYRVIASEDDTTFTTTTGKSATLQLGEFKEIDTLSDGEMCISADKPILVVMYGKSKNADTTVTIGDGFMSQVPPTDRFLSRYLFDASVIPDFTSYIASTMKTDLLVPAIDTGFTQPAGCTFSVKLRDSSNSFTSLTLGSNLFGAVAYGFMAAGGYGFPLGMVFDFNDCESNPCRNGGTCIDEAYIFTCICEPDYTGTTCDSVLAASTTDALSSIHPSSSSVNQISTTQASSTAETTSSMDSPSSLSSSILPATSTSIATNIFSTEVSLSTSSSTEDVSQSASFLETTSYFSSYLVLPSSFVDSSSLSDLAATIPLTVATSLSSTPSLYDEVSFSSDFKSVEASSTIHSLLYDLAATIPKTVATSLSSTPSLYDEVFFSSDFKSFEASSTIHSLLYDLTSHTNSLPTSSPVSITTSPASSHILDLLSSTASSAGLLSSVCACGCNAKLSQEEVEAYTEMIKKTLTVSTHNLSSSVRKKISVSDSRPSAVAVGFSGIVIIAITTLLLVCTDFITLARYLFCKSKLPNTARLTLTVTRSDTENLNVDME